MFGLIFDKPSNLGIFRTTFAFLQIPVFYLYVLSVSYSDFRLKSKYLFHALPFLIVNAVLVPRFYAVDDASKMDFIINRKSMIELQFIHILIHIQIIVYFAAIFMLLKKAKNCMLKITPVPTLILIIGYFSLRPFSVLYVVAIVKIFLNFQNIRMFQSG